MMRRLRASAACPCVTARTRVTGFNLFTREMQKEKRVLTSKSLAGGQRNMQIMSKLWSQLTSRRREVYNERARQRNALSFSDSQKKNNNFNLVMRLFGEEKVLLNAGDETFTAMMAKSTIQAMRASDAMKLRTKLGLRPRAAPKKPVEHMTTSAFHRFSNPNMALFDSFTEMQRCVAPTRRAAFSAVAKLVTLCNTTPSGEENIIDRYSKLSPSESVLFAPISDLEAPFFEVFCASRCGSLDHQHFNILQLFTAFRGIETSLKRDVRREQLYQSLLRSDRSHDGAYYRARRNLERLDALRSSDFGLHIAKQAPQLVMISPGTYGIECELDDVSVATMLAETREQRSVYDDVLERAAVLRPEEKNARLALYRVTLKAEQAEAAVAVAAVKQPKKAQPSRKAEVEPLVAKAKQTTVVASAKVAKERRPAKSATAKIAAAAPRAKAVRRHAAARATSPRKAAAVAQVKAEGSVNDHDGDVTEPVHATDAHPQPAAEWGDDEWAEELSNLGLAEEEMDALDAELDSEEVEASPAPAPVAATRPPSPRTEKVARRRSARVHLTDPKSMLPASARAERLITRHTAARKKKVLLPTSKPVSSPYMPPKSHVDLASSVRAMLSGEL